ncbi:Zinc finger, CCHC-type [Sesbania bispinosa]|nr:Zinc finger, CCHC-type [Sesbania bispinosa]
MFVPVFNGLNFSYWSEQVQFHLGVLDLDLAFQVEKPAAITDASSNEEKAHYKAWEKSNRLSLMVMRLSIATRLKSLGMAVDENFLVQFILNSLPFEYGPFQMNYNTMKDKWNGVGNKVVKKHGKGKGPLKIGESSTKIQKKNDKCHFCGKSGHFQKNCPKHKAWFEKKGEHNAYGFLSTRTINPDEKFVFMGNRMKVPMEAVGTYRLILDTGFHLDLFDTFYVPSISRNLVSLFELDVAGYTFRFGNGCFSLYKRTCKIGSGTLYDGLHKLNLDNLYAETLMSYDLAS